MVTFMSLVENHCHSTCLIGVSGLKLKANAITIIAERVTVPAPTAAMIGFGKYFPDKDSIRNPNNGKSGMRYK